jgi:hypothetical protein
VIWRVADGKASRFAGVIPVAGITGEPGGVYRNGAVDEAYFMEPWGIAPFLEGYAVTDGDMIRYIANGRVMTLAGSDKAGNKDGSAKEATFDHPTGIAAAPDGSLYVADTGNGTIRHITKSGEVTTITRNLNAPTGVCWYEGVLYVAETGRCRILKVTTGGGVHVIAGVSTPAEDNGEFYGGYVDAAPDKAKFDHPQGVAVGSDGTIYVADTGNRAVRAIGDKRVYTVLRSTTSAITPASPRGLLVSGETLYLADAFAGTLTDLSIAQKRYSDVAANAWYADGVNTATRYGIVSGLGDTFQPDKLMDRAMFVSMLSHMHQLADGTVIIDGDATFKDVAADAPYAAAVRWAADNEIVRGNGDDTFAPDRGISRQELAALLYRYAQSQGLNVSGLSSTIRNFKDGDQVSDWAMESMSWACTQHILNGDDQHNLNPRGPATRAQALTMLLNFMENYGI